LRRLGRHCPRGLERLVDAPLFLIVHGSTKQNRLYRALVDAGAPAELVPIEDGYHNWNPRPDPIWPKVRYFEFAQMALRFFKQHL
jgi:hypothetical protein